jgi:hypothetical protein
MFLTQQPQPARLIFAVPSTEEARVAELNQNQQEKKAVED